MRRISFVLSWLLLLGSPGVVRGQNVVVTTNGIDWLDFGTVNAELSVAVSKNLAVSVGGKYNPWHFGSGESRLIDKSRMLYAAARWYTWFVFDGFYWQGHAGWLEYASGGIFGKETEEGDALGLGGGFGWSRMISSRVNLELGFGFWAGRKKYTEYKCPTCGRQVEHGTKFFIQPMNIVVGVSWVIGGSRKNRPARRRNVQYND